MRYRLALAFLLLATVCASARGECVDPSADAASRLHVDAATLQVDTPDLDDDGNSDAVVHERRHALDVRHLVYVVQAGCGRLTGDFKAVDVACVRPSVNGGCTLVVDRSLMHGDRSRARFVRCAVGYCEKGPRELVHGPRPPGPKR